MKKKNIRAEDKRMLELSDNLDRLCEGHSWRVTISALVASLNFQLLNMYDDTKDDMKAGMVKLITTVLEEHSSKVLAEIARKQKESEERLISTWLNAND